MLFCRGLAHLLGQIIFILQRHIPFLNLSRHSGIRSQRQIFDDLLGDGTSAFDIAILQDTHARTKDTLNIDSIMLVETGVLDGNDSVLHVFGDLIDCHLGTEYRSVNRGHLVSICIINI